MIKLLPIIISIALVGVGSILNVSKYSHLIYDETPKTTLTKIVEQMPMQESDLFLKADAQIY